MISGSPNSLAAPYNTNQLFWLTPPRDGWALYSPASFFFASADGARLVPAMSDEERFVSALTEAIGQYTGYSCVSGLQGILDKLTADNTPPAPRYPQIGDTNVRGRVVEVFDAPWFITRQQSTPPPWWSKPWTPVWMGIVITDIGSNGYSTPPANLVEADSGEVGQFRFQFSNGSAVVFGACTFDIVASAIGMPMATSVKPA
jgi:hypothetical protein